MRNIIIALLAVLAINAAYASPIITGILYDPNGTDTGQEWIEIYNPTLEAIDLSAYTIQRGNGAKENDWVTVWNGSNQLFQPLGYYLIAEYLDADNTVKLVLGNGPDAIRLQQHEQTLETIGYGTHLFEEYYQESPTVDVSNKPLIRLYESEYSQTGDNSIDFIAGTADYEPKSSTYITPVELNTTQEIELELVIENQAPTIESVIIPDDDLIRPGIQQVVLASKNITVSLLVNDVDGIDDISQVTATLKKGSEIISQTIMDTQNQSALAIPITLNPLFESGRYDLEVSVKDAKETTTYKTTISIVPAIGIYVAQSKLNLIKMNATTYEGTMTVSNTANSPVRIEVRMGSLAFKHHVFISDGLQSLNHTNQSQTFAASLNSGQNRTFTIQLTPTQLISKGTYNTNITAIAHALQ